MNMMVIAEDDIFKNVLCKIMFTWCNALLITIFTETNMLVILVARQK